MSKLKNKIKEDLKQSMKERNAEKTSVMRMALAAINNKEIELRKKEEGLSEEEIYDVLRTEAKRRRDSIAEFQKAGREELVAKENKELEIIKKYLPAEISDEELNSIVAEGVKKSQAAGPADFGKAMKIIMPLLKGKASGSRVSGAVKKQLEAV